MGTEVARDQARDQTRRSVRDQAADRRSMGDNTDIDFAARNTAAGNKWIARFRDRAEKIVKSVLRGEQPTDQLTVPVYSPPVGVVHVRLVHLLCDPDWRNGMHPNKRAQVKILDETFMSAAIYEFLQKMV